MLDKIGEKNPDNLFQAFCTYNGGNFPENWAF